MMHIALLRGVNVGGNKMIAMADLREIASRLGLEEAKTLLQSGNLIFRSNKSPAALEALLAREIDAEIFVRSAQEWRDIVAGNPFTEEAQRDPGHLLVMALKKSADAKALVMPGREVARGNGRHLYLYYPDGAGTSKLTNAVIER